MIKKTFQIWENDEYNYKRAGTFIPTLTARIHEDSSEHPAMIIVPGGVYVLMSIGEAEFVSRNFYDLGYNTFVLTYTNNVTLDEPPRFQPLKDISRAVRYIRRHREDLHINSKKVYACGFSAGGHLVGCLATHYDDEILKVHEKYQEYSNRPDAILLNYPMISGKQYAPECGFKTLMGANMTEDDNNYMSLELHVSEKTPPTFIIHGMADNVIPVEQSMLFMKACMNHGVPCEAHFIQNGNHGVTTMGTGAKDAQESSYMFRQLYKAVKAMSIEEAASYKDILGPLNKDMDFGKCVRHLAPKGMMHIYMKALGANPEKMGMFSSRPGENPSQSISEWFQWADNWIKILPESNL